MASTACGLDFGTSNSTVAVMDRDAPVLLPVEDDHRTIPSALFFGTEPDTHFLIGRAATAAYVEGLDGRLLRSLKSILGSSLIDEKTTVHKRRISFADIVRLYLAEVKRRAEAASGRALDRVVHGRPVHFVDDDAAADRRAEETLRRIAEAVGFREVSFQYEPVAAAHAFERSVSGEHLAIVADIGGGTSDFTVVRLGPARARADDRTSDLLANDGLRLGGTDYDRYLSMAGFMPLLGLGSLMKRGDVEVPAGPYWDLSTWHTVHELYDQRRIASIKTTRFDATEPDLLDRLLKVIDEKRGHGILVQVEAAKIALSDATSHSEDLGWLQPGLRAETTRALFEAAVARRNARLAEIALRCCATAGVAPDAITAVFFTGGTSHIPSVRAAILGAFGNATAIDGDRFGAVGLGLAIEAERRYGR